MELKIPSKIKFCNRNKEISLDLLDPKMGAFLGAFMSEGNLTEMFSVKISCKDLNFINSATNCINEIFGDIGATNRKPTKEDNLGKKGFHKYYSKWVAKCLVEGYGITPGKKVLNNKGLPEVVMKNMGNKKTIDWFRNYLQTRFSGDGHVRNSINKGKYHYIVTRRVALTRCMALNVNKHIMDVIDKHHKPKKKINEYPQHLIRELKNESRKKKNFPKEFKDIQILLSDIFGVNSKIYPYGLRCIYFDKKRERYIVSAIYKLVISRKNDIMKFHEKINFAPFDHLNRKKLINLIQSYKR